MVEPIIDIVDEAVEPSVNFIHKELLFPSKIYRASLVVVITALAGNARWPQRSLFMMSQDWEVASIGSLYQDVALALVSFVQAPPSESFVVS